MTSDFPLIVRRAADNRFIVESEAFGVMKSGEDLVATEAAVRDAVVEMLRVIQRNGLERRPDSAAGGEDQAPPMNRSVRGLATATLVTVAVLLPVWLGVSYVSRLNFSMLTQLPITTKALAAAGSRGIARTADVLDSITPERRVDMVRNLGRIAHALEPYAAQLRPLWQGSGGDAMDAAAADGKRAE